MKHYFAYGSNMDPRQMRRRCRGSTPLGRAMLPEHRLTFPRSSRDWGGGVAGIEPAAGAMVEGVLYHVTDDDLAALDGYEGLAAGHYVRRQVPVHQPDGKALLAWVYFANPDPAGAGPPSRAYLDALIRGARHHRLPEAYIARLAQAGGSDDAGRTPRRVSPDGR